MKAAAFGFFLNVGAVALAVSPPAAHQWARWGGIVTVALSMTRAELAFARKDPR